MTSFMQMKPRCPSSRSLFSEVSGEYGAQGFRKMKPSFWNILGAPGVQPGCKIARTARHFWLFRPKPLHTGSFSPLHDPLRALSSSLTPGSGPGSNQRSESWSGQFSDSGVPYQNQSPASAAISPPESTSGINQRPQSPTSPPESTATSPPESTSGLSSDLTTGFNHRSRHQNQPAASTSDLNHQLRHQNQQRPRHQNQSPASAATSPPESTSGINPATSITDLATRINQRHQPATSITNFATRINSDLVGIRWRWFPRRQNTTKI
jgi:hypothetical protein